VLRATDEEPKRLRRLNTIASVEYGLLDADELPAMLHGWTWGQVFVLRWTWGQVFVLRRALVRVRKFGDRSLFFGAR
jgi:hypothetical protein